MFEVTRILSAIDRGERQAADQLLPLVYDELRKLAAVRLAAETPGQTLVATALVHEAYLRLVGGDTPQDWSGRGHFFAAAAEAMRRILIERARHNETAKAGGGRARVDLDDVDPAAVGEPTVDLLALDEALKKFEVKHPRKARVVKLRFFAGLTTDQAAKALDVSVSTVDKEWAYARSWLRVEMSGAPADGPA